MSEKKEKEVEKGERFVKETIPTETAQVIRDTEKGNILDNSEILAFIMNKLEDIDKRI